MRDGPAHANTRTGPETPSTKLFEPWSSSPASFSQHDADLAILLQPSRSLESESMCYFILNYVNIPRDPTTNIFVEHILPLYLSAPADSALSYSVTAVAIHSSEPLMSHSHSCYASRKAYGEAVALLKLALQDPVESKTDETLAAVYMLDFYDSMSKRYVDFVDTGTHQQGGAALLRHRGESNFKTPLSQRLFLAMRSRHINHCLESGLQVQLDADLLDEGTATLPQARIDLLKAELASINVLARGGPEEAGMGPVEFYHTIATRALSLEKRICAWRESLPQSWQPVAVPASQLHPSIRAAGLYNDMCEVYSSLAVSHIHHASRGTQTGALRLVDLCQNELESLGVPLDPNVGGYIEAQVQEMADRFCASVPFHLGNMTTMAFPHEYTEYPHIPAGLRRLATYVDLSGNPVEMTMEDHVRAAAAIGGFFLLTPLHGFAKTARGPFMAAGPPPLTHKLRKGQREWIQGQLERMRKIFLLPSSAPGNPVHLH